MQTYRLARLAAEAEKLRWKRRVSRLITRAIYGAIAALFAIAALVTLHVLGYIALRLVVSPLVAAAIVLAVDLVIAVILAVLATLGGPDPVELEAVEVRQKALTQIGESLALVTMVRGASRLMGKRGVYGMTLAALTARFLSR